VTINVSKSLTAQKAHEIGASFALNRMAALRSGTSGWHIRASTKQPIVSADADAQENGTARQLHCCVMTALRSCLPDHVMRPYSQVSFKASDGSRSLVSLIPDNARSTRFARRRPH
jgi:hypothetical protein